MAALSQGSCEDDLSLDGLNEEEEENDREANERVRVILDASTEHLLEDGTLLVSAGMDGMIAEEQEIEDDDDDVEYSNEEEVVSTEEDIQTSSSQPAILLAASALGLSIATANQAVNDGLLKRVDVGGGKNGGGGATTLQLLVCDDENVGKSYSTDTRASMVEQMKEQT